MDTMAHISKQTSIPSIILIPLILMGQLPPQESKGGNSKMETSGAGRTGYEPGFQICLAHIPFAATALPLVLPEPCTYREQFTR